VRTGHPETASELSTLRAAHVALSTELENTRATLTTTRRELWHERASTRFPRITPLAAFIVGDTEAEYAACAERLDTALSHTLDSP